MRHHPPPTALLFSLMIAASACAPGPRPPDNEPIPATDQLRAIQGTSWLVRRVSFDEPHRADAPQPFFSAGGFDIDRLDSGSDGDPDGACDEYMPDLVSDLDDGITGVDNSGAWLMPWGESLAQPATFEAALDEAMREGRVRWALRVGELDEDGTSIPLELFVIDESDVLRFDSEGMLARDQRLRARRIAETRALVRRAVAWGYVETTELTVSGDVLLLPFYDLRTAAFGVAAGPSRTELHGSVGGSFSVDSLVDVIRRDFPSRGDAEDFRSVFVSFADLVPSSEDPLQCERISVGFGFEAVPVELVTD